MEKYIHPKANISSNLFRLSALLTLAGYFLFSDRKSFYLMIAVLIAIFLLIGAAYLIRRGYTWVRWVLLVLFILAMSLDVISIPSEFKSSIAYGCFGILQDIIQLTAVIILFIPYKLIRAAPEPTET